MTKKKITYKDVDWESYRENVENSIANERLWATEFSRENIADLEDEEEIREEIEAIIDADGGVESFDWIFKYQA